MVFQKRTKGRTKRLKVSGPRWFSVQSVIAIFIVAVLACGGLVTAELRGLLDSGHKPKIAPGWILDGDQLHSLLAYTPSTLPATYFNTAKAIVLKPGSAAKSFIPTDWVSTPGFHYTSLTAKGCGSKCYSLSKDITAHSLHNDTTSVALYDDEYWSRTPGSEQRTPCGSMSQFVSAAHAQGLTTIVAPDQDLAQPRVITHYQGGESENWQTYLRLGLGACAAQSGSEWYHIMSQPFEAHWCGDIVGVCDSSESDFVNFVTQAALQAKSVNPNIKISDGLSTNPKYFGYFRGAGTLAQIMYRDYADVQPIVDAVWLNIVGPRPGVNTTALYFLSTLNQHPKTDRRSSVLFLRPVGALQNKQPAAHSAAKFDLSDGDSDQAFVSSQTLPGGTSLPDGTGEFQFWTDGNASDAAQIGVNFGYCKAASCDQRTAVTQSSLWVHGNQKGATVPGGAFTTKADTILPKTGGPYRLYVRVFTETPAPINLLFGSADDPTNLATPVLLSL